MRGMDYLIAQRRQGFVPAEGVLLYLAGAGGCVRNGREVFRDCVVLDSTDRPGLTDLRPLVGLQVIVVGLPWPRFDESEAWAREACKAGAKHVGLSIAIPPEQGHIDGPVWLRKHGEDLA